MQSPRITVLCPCYNDGATVVETVESVRENEPIEILLVDDGSTDPQTVAVLAEPELRDNIRVVRHEVNRGVTAGLNTGLNEARGEFVFFIGADDLIEPGALTRLADALNAAPDAVVAWGHYEFFGAHTGTRKTPPWDPWRLIYNNYWTGVAMARRQELLDLGGFSMRSAYEDWDMWMSVAQAGKRGLVVDTPMFKYRIHKQSVRRCSVAKDHFPAQYEAMRDGHRELFSRRKELAKTSHLSALARLRERVALLLKRRLPKHVRRAIYGSAAWLETRRESQRGAANAS